MGQKDPASGWILDTDVSDIIHARCSVESNADADGQAVIEVSAFELGRSRCQECPPHRRHAHTVLPTDFPLCSQRLARQPAAQSNKLLKGRQALLQGGGGMGGEDRGNAGSITTATIAKHHNSETQMALHTAINAEPDREHSIVSYTERQLRLLIMFSIFRHGTIRLQE